MYFTNLFPFFFFLFYLFISFCRNPHHLWAFIFDEFEELTIESYATIEFAQCIGTWRQKCANVEAEQPHERITIQQGKFAIEQKSTPKTQRWTAIRHGSIDQSIPIIIHLLTSTSKTKWETFITYKNLFLKLFFPVPHRSIYWIRCHLNFVPLTFWHTQTQKSTLICRVIAVDETNLLVTPNSFEFVFFFCC